MDLIWTNFQVSALVLALFIYPLWALSLALKDASIIDIFWGFGFVIVACVSLACVGEPSPYQLLVATLPIIWGLRLALYLAQRNIGKGEDRRYTRMRKNKSDPQWRRFSFWSIYTLQGILILIVSAPIWWAMAAAETQVIYFGVLSLVGFYLWLIGFLFEAIADWQLSRFQKQNADYDGPYEDKPVLDTGLWKFSRHPNYFGNALLWWGIGLIACEVPWGWVTLIGPALMTVLLVKVSGRDLLERQLKKRAAYREYVERTSSFVPLPPKRQNS